MEKCWEEVKQGCGLCFEKIPLAAESRMAQRRPRVDAEDR